MGGARSDEDKAVSPGPTGSSFEKAGIADAAGTTFKRFIEGGEAGTAECAIPCAVAMFAKQSGVRGRGRACGRNLLALKPMSRIASGTRARRKNTLTDERLIKCPDAFGNRLRCNIVVFS